jgi:SAM-dependent methyltransferase
MNIWPVPGSLEEMFRLATARQTPDWLPDPEGPILNIGHGNKLIDNANHLDLPQWDADMKMPVPFRDGYFSAIYAMHFMEHIREPIWMMREFQRVLAVGGHLNIGVPYYSSQCAFQDLDHKTFWCEETWKHIFSQEYYAKGHEGWKFSIGANYIMGIVERNMMLITQLIREE